MNSQNILMGDPMSCTEGRPRGYTGYLCKEGILKGSPWKELKGQIYLGGMEFINKLKAVVRKTQGIKEIPRVQRYASRPGLSETIKMDVKLKRDESTYKAHAEFGYSLKEIADYHDLHYTTVSKVISAMEHKSDNSTA